MHICHQLTAYITDLKNFIVNCPLYALIMFFYLIYNCSFIRFTPWICLKDTSYVWGKTTTKSATSGHSGLLVTRDHCSKKCLSDYIIVFASCTARIPKATTGGLLRCSDTVRLTINYEDNHSYRSNKSVCCLKPYVRGHSVHMMSKH